MTATEELRALLDEREVEWEAWNDRITAVPPNTHYLEVSSGTLCVVVVDATPAKAVELTMGRETCTMAHEDGNDTWWSCNECDADVYLPTKPKFCWNCGREVVE